MPARYFHNHLPDHVPGTPVAVNTPQTLHNWAAVLRAVLTADTRKSSVYTGAAGIAYALWHTARHSAQLSAAVSESDLLAAAERYARAALNATSRQPPERSYGWSLLAGQAGVLCTGALVFDAAAAAAQREGRHVVAEALRSELRQCVERYASLSRLAASSACEEDEVLYGRSGYLLGALLLNRQLATAGEAVTAREMQAVVHAIIASGREQAVATPRCPSPLYYEWHNKPYLGAAHGMIGGGVCAAVAAPAAVRAAAQVAGLQLSGILFALLHVPELLGTIPGALQDVEAALRYVLTLECDAEGRPGQSGHYPTQMGPWRDCEPLVHWCHGATGAVFLFCKALEALPGGDASSPYLAAAERAGEAVWERGLLKKGPGSCHGISGSAYALLRLHRATGHPRWLHRALQFAGFMHSREFLEGSRTPDHPLSLFEGQGAQLCLLADLLGGPLSAAFPMFEVDF